MTSTVLPIAPPLDESLRDRAWKGYDGRAMLPVAAAAAVASLVLLTGRWYLTYLTEVADRIGALVLFGLVALLWAGVAAVWLYRTITYTYRLSGRALLVDRGFRWRTEAPVMLADLAEVRSGFGPIGRHLGVGRVEAVTRQGRLLVLTGVHDPSGFAAAIRKAAAEGNRPD